MQLIYSVLVIEIKAVVCRWIFIKNIRVHMLFVLLCLIVLLSGRCCERDLWPDGVLSWFYEGWTSNTSTLSQRRVAKGNMPTLLQEIKPKHSKFSMALTSHMPLKATCVNFPELWRSPGTPIFNTLLFLWQSKLWTLLFGWSLVKESEWFLFSFEGSGARNPLVLSWGSSLFWALSHHWPGVSWPC